MVGQRLVELLRANHRLAARASGVRRARPRGNGTPPRIEPDQHHRGDRRRIAEPAAGLFATEPAAGRRAGCVRRRSVRLGQHHGGRGSLTGPNTVSASSFTNRAWPGGTCAYVTTGFGRTVSERLACDSSSYWACFGAIPQSHFQSGQRRNYWGVGIDHEYGCTGCCASCDGGERRSRCLARQSRAAGRRDHISSCSLHVDGGRPCGPPATRINSQLRRSSSIFPDTDATTCTVRRLEQFRHTATLETPST